MFLFSFLCPLCSFSFLFNSYVLAFVYCIPVILFMIIPLILIPWFMFLVPLSLKVQIHDHCGISLSMCSSYMTSSNCLVPTHNLPFQTFSSWLLYFWAQSYSVKIKSWILISKLMYILILFKYFLKFCNDICTRGRRYCNLFL